MDQLSAAVLPGQDTNVRVSSFKAGLNKCRDYLILYVCRACRDTFALHQSVA